jgi:hypothetical protein
MNSELDRMWNEAVVAWVKVLSQNLHIRTKENHEISQNSGSQEGYYYLHGQVGWRGGNFPHSYSGSTEFKSRPLYRFSWLRIFVVFSSPSRQVPGWYTSIKLRLLPSRSFPVHESSCHAALCRPDTASRASTHHLWNVRSGSRWLTQATVSLGLYAASPAFAVIPRSTTLPDIGPWRQQRLPRRVAATVRRFEVSEFRSKTEF